MEKKLPAPPIGVIESLSRGFEITSQHVVILLIPLLLDLILWFGPRVSFAPAIERFEDIFLAQLADMDAETTAQGDGESLLGAMGLKPELLSENLQETLGGVEVRYLPSLAMPSMAGSGMQLTGYLLAGSIMDKVVSSPQVVDPAMWLRFSLPSLLVGRVSNEPPLNYSPNVWVIGDPMGMVSIHIALTTVGLFLSGVYVALIAIAVRQAKGSEKLKAGRVPLIIFQTAAFGILLILLTWVLTVPVYILGGMLALVSGPVAVIVVAFGSVFVLIVIMWLNLYLLFTIPGMYLNNRWLLAAMWDSVRVVQWNLPATLGMVLIIVLLDTALTWFWLLPGTGSWLIIASVLGHAFVSTGLLVSLFVFFQDRHRHWKALYAVLLEEMEQRRAAVTT